MNSSHAHIVFLVCICITAFRCPKSIENSPSCPLNLLPSTFLTKKVRKSIDDWLIRWPSICAILLEMDYLAHSQIPEPSDHHLLSIQQRFSDN
ncbi:uncharacterized protein BX663DRAFT_257954 [Cokeromyces recurvatus]|uniref:uncharacterized protein n=1 Tax=Cokeromyces recurvatus TaxID=90255 RepID=UPI00221E4B09|nr:uncharacterized protein BX663DRAFT_257954 [Cokeromyces recurvatus]KAI7898440.1 hypothetical protein BX663DRAFT_257954 [Cokeromyces recurvatus]